MQEDQMQQAERGPASALVYVSPIPEKATEEELGQYFGQYGTIVSVTMKRNAIHGYAFVQFKDVISAQRILTVPHTLDGVPMNVRTAKENSTLFLTKIGRNLSEDEVRDIAQAYGEIEKVSLIRDKITHQSKGTAFIKFIYKEDAIAAFSGLHFSNPLWVVEWAKEKDTGLFETNSIYIGGFGNTVTEQDLRQQFSAYGEIVGLSLIPSKVPDRTGCCFIKYTTTLSAEEAIRATNGITFMGTRLRVQLPDSPIRKRRKKEMRDQAYMFPYGGQPLPGYPPAQYPPQPHPRYPSSSSSSTTKKPYPPHYTQPLPYYNPYQYPYGYQPPYGEQYSQEDESDPYRRSPAPLDAPRGPRRY
jgi:RNA recognition motif-containing protein